MSAEELEEPLKLKLKGEAAREPVRKGEPARKGEPGADPKGERARWARLGGPGGVRPPGTNTFRTPLSSMNQFRETDAWLYLLKRLDTTPKSCYSGGVHPKKKKKTNCSNEFALISSLTCSLVTRLLSDCEDSVEEESYYKKSVWMVSWSRF